MKTQKFQLKNGLTVLLIPSTKSPVVSVQMWVRNGSADELKGEEGISHFIEHLLFKGSRKYAVGEIAKIIEGSGGELNAYTSFDQTVFYVTLSKHEIDVGLDVVLEMMGYPIFDASEIENEREVVVEEIKRGQDSLGRRASQLLFSSQYKKHPYGIPVIGYEKNVRRWPAKKIKEFYQGRYNPKNMFLVVAGDFEAAQIKKQISKQYSELPQSKLRKSNRKKEPMQKSMRIDVEKTNFQQNLCYLSWKIPNVKHVDIPALDLIGSVLGQGDSSRFVQRLRIQEPAVNSIGAGTFTANDSGLFTISFSSNAPQIENAMTLLTEELSRFLKEGPSLEELQKAVLNTESEDDFSRETVDGLSRKFGSLEFYFKDLKYMDRYLKAIKAATPEQLVKIAKKYLDPKTMCVSVVTNEDENKIKKLVAQKSKELAQVLVKAKKEKLNIKLKKSAKKVKKSKSAKTTNKQKYGATAELYLDNGIRILVRPLPDTKVVNLRMAAMGGLQIEDTNLNGMTELMRRSWLCGTKNRSEEAFNLELESMAAGLGSLGGRNSIGLSMDYLSSFEEKALDIFCDAALNPTFANEAIEREKSIQLEQIKTRNDNPGQVCGRLFMKHMFENSPYGMDSLGEKETLEKLNQKNLKDFYLRHLKGKNLTFSVAGDVDKDRIVNKLNEQFKSVAKDVDFKMNKSISDLKDSRHFFEHSSKEQSHFILGYRALALNDENRYVLHLIESILAGQGGRLFLELRDKNSLAYTVSPMRMEGLGTGYFGAYIGCAPEKVKKAEQMMKIEFDKLCNEFVPEAELDRARRYLIGRHDIDLQRSSSVSSSILYDVIYGIPLDECFRLAEKYKNITAKQIQQVAQKIFAGHSITALVGPKNL
jgi:zinc protease